MNKSELARQLGKAFRLGYAFSRGQSYRKGVALDEGKWITVHPNGKGVTKTGDKAKGQPVLIDGETGEVLGGMGGKFKGKHISAVPKLGKEEQHGAQAKIDRNKFFSNKEREEKQSSNQTVKQEKSQAKIRWEENVEKWKQDLEKQKDKNSFQACFDRMGISGFSPDSETLIGLEPKTLRTLTESVETVVAKYPSLKEYAIENYGMLKNEFIDKNTYAYCKGAEIVVNSMYFTKIKDVEKECKRQRDSGWFTDFSDKFAGKATIFHELGHMISNSLIHSEWEKYVDETPSFDPDSNTAKEKRYSLLNKHTSAILDIASKKTGLSVNELVGKYMSRYGKSNQSEFLAGAFCNLNGGKMNPIGEAMGVYLAKVMKQ